MLALSVSKFFTAICLLGIVLAHPLEGALEERHNGPSTSVSAGTVHTVTLGGGGSSAGCATVTYLPGPTTTIVASSVTITSYTSRSPITLTSYIPHPTATATISSSHVPVTTQYTTVADGTATAIQTTIIATVTAGNGPVCSCPCEPTASQTTVFPTGTASRTTVFSTRTAYSSSAVVTAVTAA